MDGNNALREELAEYLLHTADLSFVKKLKEMVSYEKSKKIVAYTVQGDPLTVAEYQQELENAEKEIERGEFLTSEALEIEIAKWSE